MNKLRIDVTAEDIREDVEPFSFELDLTPLLEVT